MAIIRKGDKKAEGKLRLRASQEKLDKIDRFIKTSEDTPAGKRARKVSTDKGVTGASDAVFGNRRAKDMDGPVSGSALAAKKAIKGRSALRKGAGVIEKGKLIKGGSEALKNKLDDKAKK
jgi:hypothetical protein